ncbi:protein-methionine-sulfoxide reductase heme-binding subunit MsrQ [Paenirhodobacter populi]|uniref:Protein-methionine-sulfoxide reductase heme-binding subunit MsrQ n=1 Tax=Paenirhodobacter populi TaxID=2306993 RepID=A0A443ILL0_9RHOB|nr:protein-methionine-sulfoxide reductase heme-binding subunit MsrQ [Sinirhodobacter populi]RWR06270.1 protein-methionine-sulfoxide reductase heme-binding subunit MsrQ [Sinirhodobacter populi]RWR06695.1 protein-methionine-sulfoxide reductase heme-binding subunit MsrQ [Sinirhodobacter populi]
MRKVPVGAVYLAGLAPLGWIVWLVVSGGIGVDPVKEIEHRLGKIALWFLFGGLAITPLRRFLRIDLLRYRRAVGLVAFFYVGLHVLVWLVLDMGMLWAQALGDLVRRPYLILGVAALLLLLPLALTSNTASIRRLGRNWRRLHLLVYPAVALAVVHYLWQMKVVQPQGWLWLAGFGVLMALRAVPRRR